MTSQKRISGITLALGIAGAFGLIYLIKGMLILLILPFLFAYLLNPFVNYMERKGLSRGVGTLIVFLSISLILTGAIVWLSGPVAVQIHELRTNSGKYEDRISGWITKAEDQLGLAPAGAAADGTQSGAAKLRGWMKKWAGLLPGVVFGVLGSVITFLAIVPLIAFFLLRDGREIRRKIIALIPNRHFERMLIIQYEVSQQIGKYLRGEMTRSIIVGALITIGLFIVDGPYPILMGFFAAATNVIPFVGPYIGAIPALLIVLFSNAGPEEANIAMALFSVAMVYGISQTLDMIIIQPLVLGKSVELHPLIIILALLVGVEFLGLLGMVLAVPFACIMKVILVQLYESQRAPIP